MTPATDELLEQALRLSPNERGDLAARLIDSLDPADELDVEAAWGEEIQRRLHDFKSGAVKGIPWPEARRMILEEDDESGAA